MNSLNAVESENIPPDHCVVCRFRLIDLCMICRADRLIARKATVNPIEECTPVRGTCNHIFHSHCMQRWVHLTPTCPVDKLPWSIKEE